MYFHPFPTTSNFKSSREMIIKGDNNR